MAKRNLNTYYQYNAEGIYIGPVEAETCPENATEKAPEPNGDDNLSAIWNGAAWLYLPNVTIEKAAAIRAKRDALLAGSDYTQLPDADVDPEAWVKYRQELRDITKGEDFPLSVTWPTKPTGKRPEPKPSPLEEKLASLSDKLEKLDLDDLRKRVKTLENKKPFPATGPAAAKKEEVKDVVEPRTSEENANAAANATDAGK